MNIFTIDLEDYFHILDTDINLCRYNNLSSNFEYNIEKFLDILESTNSSATFFCLGWIAEKYPTVIKKISQKYEIASHSYCHDRVGRLSEEMFREDMKKSINTIENITAKKVRGYRAPGFSLSLDNKWAFETLAENGIEYDSSIIANKPFQIQIGDYKIKEFPISYYNLLSKKWIFSGGGYFRFYPYWFIRRMTNKREYNMCYIHPSDIDRERHLIKSISLVKNLKSCYGIGNAEKKLKTYLSDFKFIDIDSVLSKSVLDF